MIDVVIDVPNTLPRLDAIWVFATVDENGEGIIAAPLMGPGSLVPFVAGDESRVASLRPIAQQMSAVFGKRVRLVKFTHREVLEEFGGQ